MLRISQYLKALHLATPITPARQPRGPVVIWNLIRRCNLTCKHCYTVSADIDFPHELSTEKAFEVLEDLKAFGVPVIILSGGEPLLRKDIFQIAHRAKDLGFYVALSSNGTLINGDNIEAIAAVNFDYVGISLDGLEHNHDQFRQRQGAFKEALGGIDACVATGIKVGMRFTLTENNHDDLPPLLDLMGEHQVNKFYLSHLNYSGRGRRNRKRDAFHQTTRDAMDLLFERAMEDVINGSGREYVTGNNDADGPFLLHWVARRFPESVEEMKQRLLHWGGNSCGMNIANIDNTGNVHPDSFWWDYNLGNVKQQPFSEIWGQTQDPLMTRLRQQPRPVQGRCQACRYLAMCNGNTRVRAYTTTGNPWAEDPGCYLDDQEVGISPNREAINYTGDQINVVQL